MDSCVNNQKPGRVGPVVVDDIKRDLFADFSAIPSLAKVGLLLFISIYFQSIAHLMPGLCSPIQCSSQTKTKLGKVCLFMCCCLCFLQNSVLLEKEHLRVYLRIRPFTSAEDESGEAQVTNQDPYSKIHELRITVFVFFVLSAFTNMYSIFTNIMVHLQDCVTMEPPDKVVLKAPSYSHSSRLSERPVSHTAQKFQFSHVRHTC